MWFLIHKLTDLHAGSTHILILFLFLSPIYKQLLRFTVLNNNLRDTKFKYSLDYCVIYQLLIEINLKKERSSYAKISKFILIQREIHTYKYTHTERNRETEREKERDRDTERDREKQREELTYILKDRLQLFKIQSIVGSVQDLPVKSLLNA